MHSDAVRVVLILILCPAATAVAGRLMTWCHVVQTGHGRIVVDVAVHMQRIHGVLLTLQR